MELRHLRYFVAVAEELSFTKAARRLNIAQPPLSQQIAQLEDELRCALFDRTRRRIELTPGGASFLADARSILESVARAERKMALGARGFRERLAIGITSSLATSEFAALLRRFKKQHPLVDVSLVDQASRKQVEALERGEIDLSISTLLGKPVAPLETHVLRTLKLRLAVPSGHRLAKKARAEWKDLEGEPLILVDPSVTVPGYYGGLYEQCRKAGFEPQVQQYASNAATQVWWVSAGLGLAPLLIPSKKNGAGVTMIELPASAPAYPIGLLWRRDDSSAGLAAFVQFAKVNLSQSGAQRDRHT